MMVVRHILFILILLVFLTGTDALCDETARANSQANVLMREGASLDEQSKYAKAITMFTKVIQMSPSKFAYYRRGLSYFHNGQYNEALSDLSEAIKFDGNYQDAHLIRALAFLDSQEYDKALTDIDFILQRD